MHTQWLYGKSHIAKVSSKVKISWWYNIVAWPVLLGESEIYTGHNQQYDSIQIDNLEKRKIRSLSFSLCYFYDFFHHHSHLCLSVSFTFHSVHFHCPFKLHLFSSLEITDFLRFLLLWWCDFFHKEISFRLLL